MPFLLCATACRGQPPVEGRLHVTVVVFGRDTVRFTTPARAQRCVGGHGWMVLGQEGENGALVWFRPAAAADSTGVAQGHYQLRARDDTTPGRAAFVSVRYTASGTAHVLNVDAGSAELADTTAPIAASFEGLGLEAIRAQQISAVAHFESLRVADSTPCVRQ